MSKSISLVLCAITAGLLLPPGAPKPLQDAAAAASRGARDPAARELRPYVSLKGPDSRIERREFHRITTRESWRELWSRHSGKDVPEGLWGEHLLPDVDFDQCMVVAVFRGKGVNSNGEHVVSMEEQVDRVVLRIDSHSFQTAGPAPGGGAVNVTPYGMFVVPRTAKALVVEEDVQSLKNRPPTWKERARFEALPGK